MLSLFLKLENVSAIQIADCALVRRKGADDHSTGG
jgi:hypothetical protein